MAELTSDDFKRLVTLYAPETVTSVAFSPDGALLAVAAGDKVHVFSVPTEMRLSRTAAPANPTPAQP